MPETKRPSRPATVTAEVASALPMPPHWIKDGRVVCDAPELSICRLHCVEDCGSEVWPCGGYDEHDNPTPKHEMADGGECQVVLFIEASGDLWDAYDDGEEPRTDTPRDGEIECEWDSEWYVWRYAHPVARGSS